MAGTPTRKSAPAPPRTGPRAVWDDGVEDLLRAWHRRVAAAERGHRIMSDRMRRRQLGLGIPVVVLTTAVGTSVFASFGEADAGPLLVVAGSVSLLAAVLSSLQTFLRYSTRWEGHRIAAIRYETLRRDIAEALAIPRQARGDPVKQLDSVRQRMDRYAKESPAVGERLWAQMTAEFHLSDVPPDPSWPDQPIRIPEVDRQAVIEARAEWERNEEQRGR